MVFEKKQLSRVLAIALMIACAVAFMPLLNGQAFAAAKKPGKVKIKSAKQVTNTMNVKVTWAKAKNAKKYQVKVGSKTYTTKSKSYTAKNLAAGTYKVKVRGVNGKKKGAWSATKKVAVADKAAAAATITGTANVGETLTATVTNAAGEALTDGVAYQWYRVNNATNVETAIAGETKAQYVVQPADAPADATYNIFVEVTAGGKTVRSEKTAVVTNIRALGGVTIVLPNGHEAPQLGDTLELDVRDSIGDAVKNSVTYQWFVGGKKVKDATGATLTIPAGEDTYKAYLGKSVTVTVTAVKDGKYTGEVSSLATLPIIKSTIPEGVKIETSAAAPFVGETINAVFTPEGASDADATYQWFRVKNGKEAAIAGATGAEYTVTKSDEGSTLVVKVKLSTDETAAEYTFASAASKEVKVALVGATAAVASTHKDTNQKPRPTIFTTSDKAIVTVKDKDGKDITTSTPNEGETVQNFTYAWYLDSVADENQLFSGPYDAAAAAANPDYEQPTAGGTGVYATNSRELNLGGKYYLARSTTALDSLVGHKVVAVAATQDFYAAQGSVTTDPTPAIQTQLDGTVTLKGDTKDAETSAPIYVAGKTTLTATFTAASEVDADATVSYTWSKWDPYDDKYVVIEGATGSTYAIPTADIDNTAYKVEVTGTGDYYGTIPAAITDITVVKNAGQKVSVYPILSGAVGKYPNFTVQAGDALTASASVATAEPYMTYTWTYAKTGVDPIKTTGTTYTVPADAKSGETISLTAKSSIGDYVAVDGAVVATVKAALNSVTLQSDSSWSATTVDPGHNGVTEPNVGETLRAVVDPAITEATAGAVTYQWYADGEKIKGETNPAIDLCADEFGKAITVEVKGVDGGIYSGSKVTSAASGAVGAYGKLNVKMNGVVLDDNSVVGVGNKLAPVITAYIYDSAKKKLVASSATTGLEDLAKFAWTVGDKTTEGAAYTVMADDAGNTWTCTASGISPSEEGALTWGNGLEIVGDTQPTVVKVDLVHEDDPYGVNDRPNVIITTMDGVDVTEAALDEVTWQYYRNNSWNHTLNGRTFYGAIYQNQSRNVRAVVELKDGFVSDSLNNVGVVNTASYQANGWGGNNARWTYTPTNN